MLQGILQRPQPAAGRVVGERRLRRAGGRADRLTEALEMRTAKAVSGSAAGIKQHVDSIPGHEESPSPPWAGHPRSPKSRVPESCRLP